MGPLEALVVDVDDARAELDHFARKYSGFFLADFGWTVANYESMAARSTVFARWFEQTVQPLRVPGADSHLQTIGEFVHDVSGSRDELEHMRRTAPVDLLLRIFDQLLDTRVLPAVCRRADTTASSPPGSRLERTRLAFRRYMMGQLAFFAHYQHVDVHAGDVLVHEIKQLEHAETEAALGAAIASIRAFFVSVLDRAVASSAITPDDRVVFETIFPLVPPNIVHYNNDDGTAQETLSRLSKAEGFVLDS